MSEVAKLKELTETTLVVGDVVVALQAVKFYKIRRWTDKNEGRTRLKVLGKDGHNRQLDIDTDFVFKDEKGKVIKDPEYFLILWRDCVLSCTVRKNREYKEAKFEHIAPKGDNEDEEG